MYSLLQAGDHVHKRHPNPRNNDRDKRIKYRVIKYRNAMTLIQYTET